MTKSSPAIPGVDHVEELCPELRGYLETQDSTRATGTSFQMLRHPLVFAVPYHDAGFINHQLNRQLEFKLEMLKKAEVKRDWNQFVFLHERPYRLQAFVHLCDRLYDREYAKLLSDIWVDSEAPNVNHDTWVELFSDKAMRSRSLMEPHEVAALAKMPKVITVYRGYRRRRDGLSFTLSREKAEWFANRFGRAGQVVTGTVAKRHVLAYLTGRNEDEVLVLPGRVKFSTEQAGE